MHCRLSRLELMKISKLLDRDQIMSLANMQLNRYYNSFSFQFIFSSQPPSASPKTFIYKRSSAQVPLFYIVLRKPRTLPHYYGMLKLSPFSGVASAYRTMKGCQATKVPSASEHGIQVQVIGYSLQGICNADIRNLSPPRTRRTELEDMAKSKACERSNKRECTAYLR